jgi:hypothetical protein
MKMKIKKLVHKGRYLVRYRFVRPKLVVTKTSFSGDGHFIDVRYWLSRPDKINPKSFPFLVTAQNQKLGLMHFSKFGVIKSKIRKHTNTGILLFYNKDKVVRSGDSVTLYWDGLKITDILIK